MKWFLEIVSSNRTYFMGCFQHHTPFKKYGVIFFIGWFLASIHCMAQKQKIDSLQKALLHLKDAARIDCLNALSEAYLFSKIDSAEIFALQALNEAEKIKYNKGAARAWYKLAGINMFAKGGDLIVSENAYNKAIALLDKTGEKQFLADVWTSLGKVLYGQGKNCRPCKLIQWRSNCILQSAMS